MKHYQKFTTMNTAFFKFCCTITGDNPLLINSSDLKSRKKIIALAMALFIPAIIWGGIGFGLAYKIYNLSHFPSVGIGLLFSAFIFLLDKIILLLSNTWKINTLRLIVGVIMSIIGATLVDTVLFEKDIDQVVSKYKKQHVDSLVVNDSKPLLMQIEQQKHLVEKAYNDWKNKLQEYQLEITGKLSGKANPGPIAQAILERAKELESYYLTERQKLDSLEKQLAESTQVLKQNAEKGYDEKALLTRIKALHELVFSNVYIAFFYLFFFTLLLILELLVIIIKITSEKTLYEKEQETYLEIMQKRNQMRLIK